MSASASPGPVHRHREHPGDTMHAQLSEMPELRSPRAHLQRRRHAHPERPATTGKRFHFVVTEAVLRYLLCPPEVMAGQLDRPVSLSTLTTLRVGVIPFDVQYTVAPVHGFYIYDEHMVRVENLTAILKLTQPSEIVVYTKIFDQFAEVACYGAEARAIITRALADLAANTE